MEQQHTKKRFLVQGIKYLAITLPLMFMGPIVINSSFKNPDHPLYYFVLSLGIFICITAMWLFYKGIQTLMKSLFGK
ncbi:DUF6095 family protein [Flavobacterium sp. JP2137]|uniref:DUF6095 family protein n=1 Tax=Flavobacterium sp. JP2137 TaxID=3414510 RepID=UPI003D3009A5